MKRLLFLLLLLCSCSPERRLQRLLMHHPELAVHDMLWKKDSIHLPVDRKDTILLPGIRRDTIILEKGRLMVKYFNSHDTVFLSGRCRDSVIVRSVPVQTTRLAIPEKKEAVQWWLVAAVLGLVLLLMIWLRK